tara:strand:+ start:183 stop:731 length:549 start_codon:yes stop_codon:yes gene_type:complete
MPLPEAKPTPDKANIYEQFSNIQASDLTRSQLDVIRDPLYLNSQSEDVLRRILLIGQVTDQLSISGPIPRTGEVILTTFNEVNEGDLVIIKKPSVGEVWVLNQASMTAFVGSSGVSLFIGSDTSSSNNNVYLAQESTSGVIAFNPAPISPVYLTSDMFLMAQGYSIDTGESSTLKVGVIRVR